MKLAPEKRKEVASATLVQSLWLICACSMVFALTTYASDPTWWSSRGAVLAPVVSTNDGVVTTNYVQNDYAAVTQGQLKQFTARAVDELDSRLTGGAGTNLNSIVSNWAADYLTNGYNATNIKPSDFTAMNVGQLKSIAGAVYGRLSAFGYVELTPTWLHQNTNTDNIAANLGQLKQVFDFDLSLPPPSNLTATAGATGSINLSWTLPSTNNVTSWLVEQQNGDGTWNVLTNLTNPVASTYSVSGLTNGQSYNFQIIGSGANSVSVPINASGTPTSGTPTITLAPVPARYLASQTITVTSSLSGATIYYTTDGSDPTTSNSSVPSNGQLTVSSTTLYKFIAVGGSSTSPVTTALYGIGNSNYLQAGDSFTMVRKSDGSVWTWGDNGRGQQGDNGTNNPAAVPQQIPGLSGITTVAAAADHAFAVKSDGTAWAWGADDQSQCGNGGTTDLPIPTLISGLSNIGAVYAGGFQGFAVDNSGNLYGWGKNDQGQLGNGTTNNLTTPTAISSISGIVKVVSGTSHTLILKSDGTVWASGSNSSGQLGDGTTTSAAAFQQITSLANVVDIAAGGNSYGSGHSMALLANGTVWTWGEDGNGELGDGGLGSLVPEEITLPPAVSVFACDDKSYVTLADGTVRCFGGNGSGQLGNGNNQDQAIPTEPPGITNVAFLAAGENHTVVCTATGSLYGWGDNSSFKLTQDFFNSSLASSAEVHDPAWQGFTSASSGYDTTLALKKDGTVWATGGAGAYGYQGPLGNGLWNSVERPVQAIGLTNVTKLVAGNNTALAIDSSGALWAWGANDYGQLGTGNGNSLNTPQQVTAVQNVISAAVGEKHVLVAESDGSVWASGDDSQNELGDGTTTNENAPIEVVGFGPSDNLAVQVAAGGSTSFALDSNGTVWAWGQNDSGQLGLGTTGNVTLPTAISTLPPMMAIAASGSDYSGSYAMGIDTSGNVWTWGDMGDPDDGTPIEQTGVTNITAISAGLYHALALKNDGSVWGLGSDSSGQLGDPSDNYADTFTQLSGVQGAVAVSAGSDYSFYDVGSSIIVKQDGSISGFGACNYGQLAANLGVYDYLPKRLFGIALNETPPVVSLTSPSASASCPMGTSINFQSSASASSGSIARVDYYLNGVKLGCSTTTGTWNFSWMPTTYGNLTFEAVAIDTAGVAQVSAPITVNVPLDSDSNGLPDWWELTYFGQLGNNATTLAPIGDNNTLLYDFQHGIVPTEGTYVHVAIVSGNNQSGSSGAYLSSPLVVKVTDGTGKPLANNPVTFVVSSGNGLIATAMQGTSFQSTSVVTDGNGLAQVYFQQPLTANYTSTITATPSATLAPSSVSFTAATSADSGIPAAPSDFAGVSVGNGEIDLSWANNADNATSIIVQQQNSDGSWSNVGSALAPTQDALAVSGLTIGNNYEYQIIVSNASGQTTATLPAPIQATASSTVPPRYVVIDLGAGMDPIKITQSGNILMKDQSGSFYRWPSGPSTPLTAPAAISEITDIGEDGTVVGDDGVSLLLTWSPTASLAAAALSSPSNVDGTAGTISKPLLSPQSNGGPSSNYLWSTQSRTVPGGSYQEQGGPRGTITLTYPPHSQTDGYFDHSEIGSYNINYNNPALWPYDPDEDIGDHAGLITWYTGYTVTPLGVNAQGHAACQRSDFALTNETDPSYPWTGSPLSQSSTPTPDTSTKNAPSVVSYVLANNGLLGSTLPFQPVSLNDDDCIIGPPTGPSIFWNKGTPTPLPSGFTAGSINAMHASNGKPAYQIVGTTDGSNLQLVQMDPQNQTFAKPSNIADLVVPSSTTWSSFTSDFTFGLSQVINDGGAIVGTATYTQQSPSDPIAAGSHGVLLTPAEIDLDYDRDGKIDPSTVPGSADAGKVTASNPWHFWINDSDENGDIGGNDVPGAGSNYGYEVVRGMRDLLNFFPVYLDIKGLLQVLPAESNTYKIKQADGAINFVLTDLTPDKAGQFLKQSPMQLNPSGNLDNPIILSNGSKVHVTSDGEALPTDWLNKIKNQNEGVILIDGYAQTTQPLVLEVTNNSSGKVMTQLKLPLSIDSIEKMYRVRNLRNDAFVGTPADQGAPDNTGEPANYPDKLTDGKNVIFLHGYNVSGTASRGWSAEMFKRFFWSGSKAKFHSITWFGDPYTTGSAVPQYHDAVINAFAASGDVATYVNGLSGQKTIIAHSLGNMVVSSAIKDHGMTVDQYFLVDAAVAEEAYDSSYTVDYEGMGHPDWMDGSFNPTYSTTLWASEWHDLFSSGDGRLGLTWRDRFAGVTGYNFYSSSENVLARYTGNPGLASVVNIALTGGQNAWALQERLKGRRVSLGVAAIGSLYGGWQFNLTDPASPADPLYYQVIDAGEPDAYRAPLGPSSLGFATNALLQRLPFFDPGFGEDPLAITPRTGNTANTVGPSWIRDLYGSSGSATASTYSKKATLLAQAFPALTQPTGANPQDIFSSAGTDQRNFDEIGFATSPVGTWPRSDNSWLHSDIKDVGYPYLYKIFDRYVTIGNLNQ